MRKFKGFDHNKKAECYDQHGQMVIYTSQ